MYNWLLILSLDFGFAHYLLGETDAAHNLRGSLLYMAPELLTHQQYNEKADLWSVGVILYGQSAYISASCIYHDTIIYTGDKVLFEILLIWVDKMCLETNEMIYYVFYFYIFVHRINFDIFHFHFQKALFQYFYFLTETSQL